MPSFDAVIFDCDGTLVDSEGLGNEALVEFLAEYGLHLTVKDAVAAFRGRKMADCIAELSRAAPAPLPETFVAELRKRTAQAFKTRLRPIEGAAELLASLAIPFCVASSGPREKIELSLSVTGLLRFFQGRIFSSYEIGVWKPDPGLFLHAARALEVAPAGCAVVEDSLPGVLAGLAAGMQVFAFAPEDAFENLPSGVRVIRRLSELSTLLR